MNLQQILWRREAILSSLNIRFRDYKDMSNYNKSRRWLRPKIDKFSIWIRMQMLVEFTQSSKKCSKISSSLDKSSNTNNIILHRRWTLTWLSSLTIQTSCLCRDQTFKVQSLVFQIKVWCLIARTALIICNFIPWQSIPSSQIKLTSFRPNLQTIQVVVTSRLHGYRSQMLHCSKSRLPLNLYSLLYCRLSMKPIANAQAASSHRWHNYSSSCKNNPRFSSNNNSSSHSSNKLSFLRLYLYNLSYHRISQTFLNQQLTLELALVFKTSHKAIYRIKARAAGLLQIHKCLLILNLGLKP